MTGSNSLQATEGNGMLQGFGNLLHKEIRPWWSSWFGLVQVIIWIVILNGIYALVLNGAEDVGIDTYVSITGAVTGYGAIIMAQGVVVGEKRSGTLSWVLSGPVSRNAIILSKLVALGLGSLVTMMALPSIIASLELLAFTGNYPSLIPMLAGMSVVMLQILFYLSLAIMLGTVFNSRGPVLGISLALIFIGPLLWIVLPDWLVDIMPWRLMALAGEIAEEQPLSTPVPIIAAAGWILTFLTLSLWRIHREEF